MNVLVAGGRDFDSEDVFISIMSRVHKKRAITTLLHGGNYYVDTLARLWAKNKKLKSLEFSARWWIYGRKALPRRNLRMLEEGNPELIIVFLGGPGLEDLFQRTVTDYPEVYVLEVPGKRWNIERELSKYFKHLDEKDTVAKTDAWLRHELGYET